MQFELRWYADGAFNLLIEVWDSIASVFGFFVDERDKKNASLVKILSILDIVITAKTGTGSKLVDRVRYFWLLFITNQES